LVLVSSGIICPSGGLFACTFRFKLAGNSDSSEVSKFLLLMAIFLVFPFFFLGFAKSLLLLFISMDAVLKNEGDDVYIGGRKEVTEGNFPILSDANKTTAVTATEHINGNFTIDCIIVMNALKDQGTLGFLRIFVVSLYL
jgi:hypothetical protein